MQQLRFEDGRIAEQWILTDALRFSQQLGLLPDSPVRAMKLLYGRVKGRLGFGKK